MIYVDACQLLGKRDLQEILLGYSQGIEAIKNGIRNHKHTGEASFPLFFLMRHSLEIGLKYNIEFLCKYSQSNNLCTEDKRKGHSLERLLASFNEHWKHIEKKYDLKKSYNKKYQMEKVLISLNKIIKFFDKIDKSSLNFRYNKNVEVPLSTWERYGITLEDLESYGDFIEDEHISSEFFQSYKEVILMLSHLEESLGFDYTNELKSF